MEEHKPTPLDALPLPPPVTLALDGRQVQLVRLALESLLWDVRRDAHLTAEIRALLAQLPVATLPPPDANPAPSASPPSLPPPATPVHRPAPAPATPTQVVDPQLIRPGYAVYAHRVDARGHADAGQFVGVVHAVIAQQGVHIVHVRGGLEHANELFLPMGAVQVIVGKQVHLNLSMEALAGQAWHQPAAPRMG